MRKISSYEELLDKAEKYKKYINLRVDKSCVNDNGE